MTIQEIKVLELLIGSFDLPVTNFYKMSLDVYLAKRERTNIGFIGYQVPRTDYNRTYWNDFSIFIPNVIDVRIECKSLATSGSLSRSVITEERLISNSMPEKKLILLTEGNGFKTKEFIETINNTKNSLTTMVNDVNNLVRSINHSMVLIKNK